VVALGLGIGGVDRPADQAVIQEWAASRYPGVPVRIVNDGLLVLAAGAPQGWGIALICGTGAIVFGCDTQGRLARAGGWGYLLGDEGGGYQISLAALRAVARAADGRGPRTSLSESILAAWSLSHPQDLIGYVYRPTVTRHHIARLAELVDQAAQQGDHIAQTIVQDAGQELALAVRSVVLQLALPAPTPCALAGSVVAQGVTVAAAFRLAAAALGLDLSPLTIVAEPAQGALKLAQGLINGVG
jgi:N-acetylglucosamine kinase-like BadF-type ATPase